MTDLMEVLYSYAQDYMLRGLLDRGMPMRADARTAKSKLFGNWLTKRIKNTWRVCWKSGN